MTHQPTVTKNYKNTQSEFDSYLGSCDVSVAPRAVRLSTSSGTQLLLLPKGNSEVPLFFHFLNYPPYVCKPSKNCNPAALKGDHQVFLVFFFILYRRTERKKNDDREGKIFDSISCKIGFLLGS